jgi:hypothetical protein
MKAHKDTFQVEDVVRFRRTTWKSDNIDFVFNRLKKAGLGNGHYRVIKTEKTGRDKKFVHHHQFVTLVHYETNEPFPCYENLKGNNSWSGAWFEKVPEIYI